MSREAMKLALEALKELVAQTDGSLFAVKHDHVALQNARQAITALREALAEQPAQQDSTCSNALRAQGKAYPRTCKKCGLGPCVELAQQALNKKAENAREQPAQKCSYPYCGCNSKAWCKVERNEALDKKAENARALGLDYEPVCNKDPQGCWNVRCQLGKKCKNTPAQRTWVGLTNNELKPIADEYRILFGSWVEDFARAIEAKLKEKNA